MDSKTFLNQLLEQPFKASSSDELYIWAVEWVRLHFDFLKDKYYMFFIESGEFVSITGFQEFDSDSSLTNFFMETSAASVHMAIHPEDGKIRACFCLRDKGIDVLFSKVDEKVLSSVAFYQRKDREMGNPPTPQEIIKAISDALKAEIKLSSRKAG